jgi:hypothetical protein
VQYLLDFEYVSDSTSGFATMGHLVVFNPSPREARLKITVYYEDKEPATFNRVALAKSSSESSYEQWPVEPNSSFSLRVESSEPVVCQATIGWNNTYNDYKLGTVPKSGRVVRETAKSYVAIHRLNREWLMADGIVINWPEKTWLKESERIVFLNPGDETASIEMTGYSRGKVWKLTAEVPARRMKSVLMDPLVAPNQHYGLRVASDAPIAAQWLRSVLWYDSEELMAFWSQPLVPAPLDLPSTE